MRLGAYLFSLYWTFLVLSRLLFYPYDSRVNPKSFLPTFQSMVTNPTNRIGTELSFAFLIYAVKKSCYCKIKNISLSPELLSFLLAQKKNKESSAGYEANEVTHLGF
jgi:hypothetical protein